MPTEMKDTVYIKAGETLRIEIIVRDSDGVEMVLYGASAKFGISINDSLSIRDCTIISSKVIAILTDEETLSLDGNYKYEIVLETADGEKKSLAYGILVVTPSLIGDIYGTVPHTEVVIADNGAKNVEVTDLTGSLIPAGYYSGAGRAILSDEEIAKIIPENIVNGITILDIPGSVISFNSGTALNPKNLLLMNQSNLETDELIISGLYESMDSIMVIGNPEPTITNLEHWEGESSLYFDFNQIDVDSEMVGIIISRFLGESNGTVITLTFSFYIKGSGDIIYTLMSNALEGPEYEVITLTPNWTRYQRTVMGEIDYIGLMLIIDPIETTTGEMYLDGLQLEYGDIATPWEVGGSIPITSSAVLQNFSGFVNGTRIDGNIETVISKPALEAYMSDDGQLLNVFPDNGYYRNFNNLENGSQEYMSMCTIEADTLIDKNIKTGVSIIGTSGNYDRMGLINPNILTYNQATVEEGIEGFVSVNGATISQDITEFYEGSASLKVECPGIQSEEGIIITVPGSSLSGLQGAYITFRAYIKRSQSNNDLQIMLDNEGTLSSNNIYNSIGWQQEACEITLTSINSLTIKITTTAIEQRIFYLDAITLKEYDGEEKFFPPGVIGPIDPSRIQAGYAGYINGELIIGTSNFIPL